MIRKYHEDAKLAGVIVSLFLFFFCYQQKRKDSTDISKLLSQNGVGSGPFDLVTFSAASKLLNEASLKTKEVIISINEAKYVQSAPTFNYEVTNSFQIKS